MGTAVRGNYGKKGGWKGSGVFKEGDTNYLERGGVGRGGETERKKKPKAAGERFDPLRGRKGPGMKPVARRE